MIGDPSLGVIIGLKEIFDELRVVGNKVDRLLAEHEQVRSDIVELRADLADKEARLRVVERARWPLPSLAALVAVGSLVLALIPILRGHP